MIDERHYHQLGTDHLILDYLIGAINELNYIRSNLIQPNEFIEKRYNWLVSIYEDSTGESVDWAN